MSEQMPDNIDEEDVSALQQQAWGMLQNRALSWLDGLRASIKGRRGSSWQDAESAAKAAKNIEKQGNGDRAIEDAIANINEHLQRLLGLYAASHQNPDRDPQEISNGFKELLRALHNPETREVLLLTVKPEYRDDIRNWFSEIGMASWGIVDLAEGNQSREFWFVAKQLADMQGLDVEDMVAQIDGVSIDQVPQEVLDG